MAGSEWQEDRYYPDEREQSALVKVFQFTDFASALKFVNAVGALAEKEQHHPDMNLGWGVVKVWLTTHDAHGITERDHQMAAAIDQIPR